VSRDAIYKIRASEGVKNMNKNRNQLARRPRPEKTPRPQLLLAPAPHDAVDPQYVVSRTDLGEFALHWTADWLAGLFSITDFPAEWIAFVRASIRGPAHEGNWLGNAPFAGATWVSTYSDNAPVWHSESPQLPPFRLLPALPP
jgi:hypothetical protein